MAAVGTIFLLGVVLEGLGWLFKKMILCWLIAVGVMIVGIVIYTLWEMYHPY